MVSMKVTTKLVKDVLVVGCPMPIQIIRIDNHNNENIVKWLNFESVEKFMDY